MSEAVDELAQMIFSNNFEAATLLISCSITVATDGEEVEVVLCTEVDVIVKDLKCGHPICTVVPRSLFNRAFLMLQV